MCIGKNSLLDLFRISDWIRNRSAPHSGGAIMQLRRECGETSPSCFVVGHMLRDEEQGGIGGQGCGKEDFIKYESTFHFRPCRMSFRSDYEMEEGGVFLGGHVLRVHPTCRY